MGNSDMSFKKRIFSGIQPTGCLHAGNYLGAIQNFVRFQESNDFDDKLYCIVDYHAITTGISGHNLRDNIRSTAAVFLASGLDPKKCIIFNQSKVPEHTELSWILSCVARMGDLGRMTQFKEKSGESAEQSTLGLFSYPVLMAADILLYKAIRVPVGDDQKQHLELARDIAKKFNRIYGEKDFFPIPKPDFSFGNGENAIRIMSLKDGTRKMSKSSGDNAGGTGSDDERLNLIDDADAIARKIKRATTDSKSFPSSVEELNEAGREGIRNLVMLYAGYSNIPVAGIVSEFDGCSYSRFKEALIAVLHEKHLPIGNAIKAYDSAELDAVLENGAAKAKCIARETINQVKEIIGF